MNILCKFRIEKNRLRNSLKSRFGRVLGSIWPGFGAPWAGFGPLLGALCLLFGRSKRYLFKALVQDKLQEAFWMDSGLILEGFGKVWGRPGQAFGNFWAHFAGLLGVQDHIFFKRCSKMSSKRPFGWILGCFWKVLGRFWEVFGRVLNGFGRIWSRLNNWWADFGHV